MTLTEFLLARIAEDEAVARAGISSQADEGWAASETSNALVPHVGIIHEPVQMAHIVRWDPWRVLAECEAKRAIVEMHADAHLCPNESGLGCTDYDATGLDDGYGPCPTLRSLAAVYADHPDYNRP